MTIQIYIDLLQLELRYMLKRNWYTADFEYIEELRVQIKTLKEILL